MIQRKKTYRDWKTILLTLRDCARGNAACLGRALDIDRVKARYHINKVKDDGLVLGYTPEIDPTLFGTPHFVQILYEPKLYRFPTQLEDTISSLIEYLKEGIGHAPLTVYVYKTQEHLQLNCITMTTDIEALVNNLYHEKNIARETITTYELEQAHAVPMYSKHSSVVNTKPDSKTSKSKEGP